MGKFKYQELFDSLKVPCPPEDYEERETIAFRWVFEEMTDERNFKPQFFKNPNRFNLAEEHIKCQALGLSLFDSAENAKKNFEDLKRRIGDNALELGTHFATGKLEGTHGTSDRANWKGHFTFHPYEDALLTDIFSIIGKL